MSFRSINFYMCIHIFFQLSECLLLQKYSIIIENYIVFFYLLQTEEQGAQTSIYLSSALEVEGKTGDYYVNCSVKKKLVRRIVLKIFKDNKNSDNNWRFLLNRYKP